MASAVDHRMHADTLAPDLYERVLAILAMALLAMVVSAVMRGMHQWRLIPPLVWLHLLTMSTALILTPVMLLRRRGDALHRGLGWAWAVLMFSSAAISFGIRASNHGGFSIIHILSAFVVIVVPLAVLAARRHNIKRHRRGIRGLVTGALLTAGFFTFPFDRLLGHWLFG